MLPGALTAQSQPFPELVWLSFSKANSFAVRIVYNWGSTMHRSSLFAAILIGVLSALAEQAHSQQTRVIRDSAAAGYVGQSVTVEGTVASITVLRTGTTFLNFGAAYPSQTFTAVIFRSTPRRFPNPQQG